MPSEIESKWKGVINKSILVVAEQAQHWKQEKELVSTKVIYSVIALGLFVTLFFTINGMNGINILRWFSTNINISLIIGGVLSFLVFTHFLKMKTIAELNHKKFKELLVKRIDAEFCNCGRPCNHKEEFMDFMNDNYKINLYY